MKVLDLNPFMSSDLHGVGGVCVCGVQSGDHGAAGAVKHFQPVGDAQFVQQNGKLSGGVLSVAVIAVNKMRKQPLGTYSPHLLHIVPKAQVNQGLMDGHHAPHFAGLGVGDFQGVNPVNDPNMANG